MRQVNDLLPIAATAAGAVSPTAAHAVPALVASLSDAAS
jgi:hypothetical protein